MSQNQKLNGLQPKLLENNYRPRDEEEEQLLQQSGLKAEEFYGNSTDQLDQPPKEGGSKASANTISIGLFSSLKKDPYESLVIQQNDDQKEMNSSQQDQTRMEQYRNKVLQPEKVKRNRMSGYQTFFAIFKGYTTMNIFVLPLGVKSGGWLFSPFCLILACIFDTLGAIKLTQTARKVGIYNYPELVQYAFGKNVRVVFEICIALLCFQFSLSKLAFFCKTLSSLAKVLFGLHYPIWIFMILTIAVFAPLAWIRTLESFRWGFMIGIFAIVFMIGIVGTFSIMTIQEHSGEAGIGWTAFNDDDYMVMLGLAFYTYEGIGSVLPIMEASDAKEYFTLILALALGCLCLIHIAFTELVYYAYGDDIVEPVIILQMPEQNPVVIIGKIFFLFNIIFSYPLNIYQTNNILESFTFSKMQYSKCRTWLKNISRTLVVTIGVIVAVTFYYKIPKIIGLSAVILGSFIALIIPPLLHNKIVVGKDEQQQKKDEEAQTENKEEMSPGERKYCRCFNIFMVVYAITVSTVVATLIILNWNKPPRKGH